MRRYIACSTLFVLVPTLVAFSSRSVGQDIAFSVDIGSDREHSDTVTTADACFDAGDVMSAAGICGYAGDILDDATIFAGDPSSTVPIHAGCSAISMGDYFDLDAFDRTNIPVWWLSEQLGEKITRQTMPQMFAAGILPPRHLVVSYEDDSPLPWCALGSSVPVDSQSTSGSTYGTNASDDEIVGLRVDPSVLPATLTSYYAVADEKTVHPDLGPDPTFAAEQNDDDVDAIDLFDATVEGTYTLYYSVDHEAHFGLDPGAVYAVGYTPPVVEPADLGFGKDSGVDLDAITFVWLRESPGDPVSLALLFSVRADDPVTFGTDESGGLDENQIYYSFMTGYSAPLLSAALPDDVDGLSVWSETVEFPPPENPLDGLRVVVVGSGVVISFSPLDPDSWNGGGIRLYRAPSAEAPYELIAEVTISGSDIDPATGEVVLFTDETVEAGRRYFYAASVVDSAGDESDLSEPVTVLVVFPAVFSFRRSDIDGDGVLGGTTDPVFLLSYLFLGGTTPPCLAAGDVNGDGEVSMTDAIYSLGHSFLGSPPPPAPFPSCGPAKAPDLALGCVSPSCP